MYSKFENDLLELLTGLRCAVCGKECDDVAFWSPIYSTLVVEARCHGKTERVQIDRIAITNASSITVTEAFQEEAAERKLRAQNVPRETKGANIADARKAIDESRVRDENRFSNPWEVS